MLKFKKSLFIINFLLLFVLVSSVSASQVLAHKINQSLGVKSSILSFLELSNAQADIKLSGNLMDDAIKLVISKGVPAIYGEELGVSFSEVQAAINVMRQYDPTYGKEKKITLAGSDLQRYIDIGLRISCEYCCGAKSIIRKDGEAACGCAHSWAMRGLIAYLIQNHGSEYTNDKILREVARWKGMYFPKQMIKKMSEQLQSGNYTPDIASLILDLDLSNYSGQDAPLPSEIKDLPSMVGGC